MYGIVTRTAEALDRPVFDRGFYQVKDVTGRVRAAETAGASMLSCFGDDRAVAVDPSLVAVDDRGEPATRDRPYFDWSYVCPSRDDYRAGLLDRLDACVEANPDVRLDDVGFPRREYCHCAVCDGRFEESGFDDRAEWRAATITEFVAAAADRVPGRLSFTMYPDPYPGHLHARNGIDLAAIESLVDEFVVTLFDTAYGTTYWIEVIASGFRDALNTPFGVELYAVDVDLDALVHAAEVADAYATDLLFAYDADAAEAAIQRLRTE